MIVNKDISTEDVVNILANGISEAKSKLFTNEISIACDNCNEKLLTKIYSADKNNENKVRKLLIYNAIGLGIYSVSTSIYDDFSRLQEKRTNKIIDRILVGDVKTTHSERHPKSSIQNP